MELTSPVRNGITPHESDICRRTFSYIVSAPTGHAGRKRLIIRAVCPEFVAVRIALASRSFAVRQQVCVMASLIFASGVMPLSWNCFQKSMEPSASLTILSIAARASTGYFPAAVSPESMTQLVPSNTAFATSDTSARVGRGLRIMESSICVAVTTGFPA